MTYEEVKDWVDIARMGYICDPNECGLKKGGDTCSIFHCDEMHDALVMVNKAVEKQTPKKPIHGQYCSMCYTFNFRNINYCPNCGQKIDWSEE